MRRRPTSSTLLSCELPVGRRLRLRANPEHLTLLHDGVVEKAVGGMEVYRQCAERVAHAPHTGDVIQVGMGQQNRRRLQFLSSHPVDQGRRSLTRIDDHGLPCLEAGKQERVLVERRRGKWEEAHRQLRIVDCLLLGDYRRELLQIDVRAAEDRGRAAALNS